MCFKHTLSLIAYFLIMCLAVRMSKFRKKKSCEHRVFMCECMNPRNEGVSMVLPKSVSGKMFLLLISQISRLIVSQNYKISHRKLSRLKNINEKLHLMIAYFM